MQRQHIALLVIGMPAIAVAAFGFGPEASVHDAHLPECTVTADSALALGVREAKTSVKFSEEIGQVLDARFPDSSKIVQTRVERVSGDPQLTARLTANTVGAVGGQWQLTLNGDVGSCVGSVWVGAAKK